MDHTSAVIDIKYSPTGKEFVTGSYDKTLRIFDSHKSKSKDIYHTKRMQRITHVSWTLDNKYIISASDEMNIRIWKAKASEKLGVVSELYYNKTYKSISALLKLFSFVTSFWGYYTDIWYEPSFLIINKFIWKQIFTKHIYYYNFLIF